MKKKTVLSLMAVFVLLWPMIFGAASTAETTPATVLTETVYQFDTAVEGSEVIHDFIVKNTGTAELAILNVQAG